MKKQWNLPKLNYIDVKGNWKKLKEVSRNKNTKDIQEKLKISGSKFNLIHGNSRKVEERKKCKKIQRNKRLFE